MIRWLSLFRRDPVRNAARTLALSKPMFSPRVIAKANEMRAGMGMDPIPARKARRGSR